MNITAFLQDMGTGQWLALAVLVAAYLRRITASDSKFPVFLPAAWQPVVSAAVGALYAGIMARQAGVHVEAAILCTVLSAGAAGLADMIVVAAWGDPLKAPGWARTLVFLFDDLTGGAGPGAKVVTKTTRTETAVTVSALGPALPPESTVPKIGSKRPPSMKPPPVATRGALRSNLLLAAGLTLLLACGMLPRVASDLGEITADIISDLQHGMKPSEILADVIAKTGQEDYALVVSILDSMLGDPKFAKDTPELVAPAQQLRIGAAMKADEQKAARLRASAGP